MRTSRVVGIALAAVPAGLIATQLIRQQRLRGEVYAQLLADINFMHGGYQRALQIAAHDAPEHIVRACLNEQRMSIGADGILLEVVAKPADDQLDVLTYQVAASSSTQWPTLRALASRLQHSYLDVTNVHTQGSVLHFDLPIYDIPSAVIAVRHRLALM